MKKNVLTILFTLLTCCSAQSVVLADDYQLYTPQPLDGPATPPEKGKGVLVRRITIQPGDTLGKLSQSYSGRSSYFPQILLFNDIRNPDLIYAGKELLVPMSRQDQAPKASGQKPPKKAAATKTKIQPDEQPATAGSSRPTVADKKKQPEPVQRKAATDSSTNREEQSIYLQALDDYHKGDYDRALKSFNRFLELHPSSPLSPDAALYKAECLFRLSSE